MSENPPVADSETGNTNHALPALGAAFALPLEREKGRPFLLEDGRVIHCLLSAVGQVLETAHQVLAIPNVKAIKKVFRWPAAVSADCVFNRPHPARSGDMRIVFGHGIV
jgi:hypothetical protein